MCAGRGCSTLVGAAHIAREAEGEGRDEGESESEHATPNDRKEEWGVPRGGSRARGCGSRSSLRCPCAGGRTGYCRWSLSAGAQPTIRMGRGRTWGCRGTWRAPRPPGFAHQPHAHHPSSEGAHLQLGNIPRVEAEHGGRRLAVRGRVLPCAVVIISSRSPLVLGTATGHAPEVAHLNTRTMTANATITLTTSPISCAVWVRWARVSGAGIGRTSAVICRQARLSVHKGLSKSAVLIRRRAAPFMRTTTTTHSTSLY